jgi:hypothetical protein
MTQLTNGGRSNLNDITNQMIILNITANSSVIQICNLYKFVADAQWGGGFNDTADH